MEIVKKRRPREIAHGFFLLSHPLPVLFHSIAVTAFALLAAWPRILWGTIVLVVTAHIAMQLSIAVLNDYCDRHLDVSSKKKKPIPLGLVMPKEALATGLLLIGVMVVLLLPLNRLALLVSLFYLLLGQGYNLGLKSTPLSGIVFALAFPLIPIYAFVGVGRIIPGIFWFVPVAALLGVALNLANSLPDVEQDAAGGVRTLAVVIGKRCSFMLCPLLLLLSAGVIGLLTITHIVPAQGRIIIPALIGVCFLSGLMMFFSSSAQSVTARKHYFYLVVCTCILLAVGWLIGALI